MNKKELAMLEKAFAAEIDGALSRSGITVLQTRSKVAEKLVDDGLLRATEQRLPGRPPLLLKGYELTHAGRLLYCSTCDA